MVASRPPRVLVSLVPVSLRRVSCKVLAGLALATWSIVLLLHTGECPDSLGSRFKTGALGVILVATLGAGLLSGRQHLVRRLSFAGLATLSLALWGVVLLGHTRYLEPLPWSAGTIGVTLLIIVALGAGLLSGWQWWTLLALPAALIGFSRLSRSLYDSGVECGPYHPAVTQGLLLVPIAVGVGALTARLARRRTPGSEIVVGSVLVLLPLVVFAWAGIRRARPIDHQPKRPPVIAEIRGQLRIRRIGEEANASGITNAQAKHAGVGIGDSLALVTKRIPGASCLIPLHSFDPGCEVQDPTLGLIWVQGDPIERIGSE